MKSPLFKTSSENNNSSASDSQPSKKSFGERKRARIQSQGGMKSRDMAWDRDWIRRISKELDCKKVDSGGIKSEDPNAYNYIPDQETWNALFRAYHATVDPNMELMSATEYKNSWRVPIEVKFHRPEGRGVYAKEFIPKGTRVWSSTTRNTATFLSPQDRRKFIEYLMKDPKTRHLACDVRMWVDVLRLQNTTNFVICETFDEAVLLNTVWDEETDGDVNIEPQSISLSADNPDRDENDCFGNDHFVAIRDIQAGEQFRIDY
ncbi:SET methyltransferase domain containing protein [Nitzschia inconspicua]|uniref:SET methyltransferase domain containing protein n=1 Tax=Nitzschia inconspicua TaxID=303405 RepID=A0A9K3KIZ4_9STRA|nr:SET methyltransferase domain containing protein [Nitzschia inconspicua]